MMVVKILVLSVFLSAGIARSTRAPPVVAGKEGGLPDAALAGVVAASMVVAISLFSLSLILLRRAALNRKARAAADLKATDDSSSELRGSFSAASARHYVGQQERPTLVFPPLEVAERGIDLDMENLFKIAGANSDSSYEGTFELSHLHRNGVVELPQARLLPFSASLYLNIANP